jgi:hypothetical protein
VLENGRVIYRYGSTLYWMPSGGGAATPLASVAELGPFAADGDSVFAWLLPTQTAPSWQLHRYQVGVGSTKLADIDRAGLAKIYGGTLFWVRPDFGDRQPITTLYATSVNATPVATREMLTIRTPVRMTVVNDYLYWAETNWREQAEGGERELPAAIRRVRASGGVAEHVVTRDARWVRLHWSGHGAARPVGPFPTVAHSIDATPA